MPYNFLGGRGANAYIYLRAFLNLEFGKCDCLAYRFAYFGPGKRFRYASDRMLCESRTDLNTVELLN
jgi:hypothetical protein